MARIHAVSFSLGTRQCPLCGGKDITRSRRQGVLEWIFLPPLLLRPYRCRQCSARHIGFYFRPRHINESESITAE